MTVEFYGVPRRRAGRAALAVRAATVRDALRAVEAACPSLSGLIDAAGALVAQYLVSLNGERFVTDLSQPLQEGDALLLMSADAGG